MIESVKIIDSIDSWEDFSSSWNELLSRTQADSPFLTYQWLRGWWDVYGPGHELHILVAYEKGAPVGIAPLYRKSVRLAGLLRLKSLNFIGDEYVGSDFLDFIILPNTEFRVLAAFWEELLGDPLWDRLSLLHWNGTSRNHSIFRSFVQKTKTRIQFGIDNLCPYLNMPRDWSSFLSSPDKTFKKMVVNRDETKLNRSHDIEFLITDKLDDLAARLEKLFQFNNERWAQTGQTGAFVDPRKQDFFRSLSRPFLEKGWLFFAALKIDDEIEALQYGIIYGKAFYGLQFGISQTGLKLKAGNVQMMKLIRELMGQIDVLNFLRGDEIYKYYWGCENRVTFNLGFFRGWKGWLDLFINQTVASGKALLKLFIPAPSR